MPNVVEDALLKGGNPLAGVGTKNDPPLAPVGPYLHGPNGLFNRRDRENPVFSAIMTPMAGVADALPVFNGARDLDGNFGGTDAAFDNLITGVTSGNLDTFSNQPTQPCQDGPVGGLMKFCSMVNTFGNYKMSTREVEITRAGRVADAVDAFSVQVANQFPQGLFATPSTTPSLQNAVNNELASRIWEMILSFQRMFFPRVFTGSPTNNNGSAQDIVGLDTHINAGNKVDARNQNVCTAADSDVKDFGNTLITATDADLMKYIEMADAFSVYRARRQGLGTPEYMIAMRPELWFELTQVIPLQKYFKVLAQINTITNARANIDMAALYNDRDALRASHLLPVNGRMIRVVEDDTIAETSAGNVNGAPTFRSTIYGIPLSVLGGYPVTFWEYFNHSNAQANAIQQVAGMLTWTTDGGMFRWTSDFSKGCLKLNATFTPRLRMRTPQIAWRINNVRYQPLQHFTSYDPSSAYFVNGGVTTGDSPRYYASWSTSTPIAPGGL